MEIFRCDRLVCRTIRAERISTLRWHNAVAGALLEREKILVQRCVTKPFLVIFEAKIVRNLNRSCYACATLRWGERFVKRTKKMYWPNPKTFRVGPYIEIFRCDRLFFRTMRAERIPTLTKPKKAQTRALRTKKKIHQTFSPVMCPTSTTSASNLSAGALPNGD